MLDVKRLKVLREVARQGSFSAAAEELSYTQSAVSQQIAALERETGTTLVDRGARGITLTEAGSTLVTYAEDVLCRLSAAEAELEALAGLRGGRVRLAAFPTVGATIVPRAFAAFTRRHPAVQLSLLEREPEEALALLRAGDIEIALAVAYDEVPLATEGIEEIDLLRDPFYLALPADHPKARSSSVALGELADERWIHDDCSTVCGKVAMMALRRGGFEPQIAFQTNDYNVAQGLVAAGVGVSLIPGLALANLREDVAIRDLRDAAPVRRIVGCLRKGAHRSAATDALIEVLVEAAAEFRTRRAALEAA